MSLGMQNIKIVDFNSGKPQPTRTKFGINLHRPTGMHWLIEWQHLWTLERDRPSVFGRLRPIAVIFLKILYKRHFGNFPSSQQLIFTKFGHDIRIHGSSKRIERIFEILPFICPLIPNCRVRIGTFCASCPSTASWDDIGHSRLGDFLYKCKKNVYNIV